MAESFSREKLRQAPQKEGGWKILCYLLPVRLVRPLKSRMSGKKKKHTHTHTHIEKIPFAGIELTSQPVRGLRGIPLSYRGDRPEKEFQTKTAVS